MTTRLRQRWVVFACIQALAVLSLATAMRATPANKASLEKHYDKFLARNLGRCTTCHLPSDIRNPESLDEFPHNPFGARLRVIGKQLVAEGKKKDIPSRLKLVAREDADGDGADNETEILLGHNPGDAKDTPTRKELADAKSKRVEFEKFLASYRWQPFEPVTRPQVPSVGGTSSTSPTLTSTKGSGTRRARPSKDTFPIRNPIDAFVAAEHKARGLKPRPEASKEILLRRVYLDLIGLSPTPEELAAFESDKSPDAYEEVVDRLLADPRYGERWARHWMDVWRYSDWAGWSGGNQIRDSKPHIWRWRDWIVESLNANKPYSQMIEEMLAADEIAPRDTNILRATGFLVRNYKMLSREQWLEDTVKHTSQAFLGVTMGCAKCHDHMFDPISQDEYYKLRAVFEPHWVRTDKLPGNTNSMELGLVRTFDTDTNPPTFFFNRGDERKPDTNRLMQPDVPRTFGGSLAIQPVSLPWIAGHPDKEGFVYRDALAAADKAVAGARAALAKLQTNSTTSKDQLHEQELSVALVEAQQTALAAVVKAEQLEDAGRKSSEEWKLTATNALVRQREMALADAKLKQHQAKVAEADAQAKADAAAEKLSALEGRAPRVPDQEPAVQQVVAKKDDSLQSKRESVEKADKALKEAKKKLVDAEKLLADAGTKLREPADTAFKHRSTDDYPTNSTGRRLAFAHWLASTNNPLTARVAVNHIWQRHFGQGIVPTPQDFGRNGKPATHPQLLDWLAAELMEPTVAPESSSPSPQPSPSGRGRQTSSSGKNPSGARISATEGQFPLSHGERVGVRGNGALEQSWSMKHLHRLIVTSSTYRMASTPDERNAKLDPDNTYLWRMNSRRMEAEVVRDNLLYIAGDLDMAMGGPDIDHMLGLKSRRRSIYLRQAAEKEVEFLKIFDGPAVTECYVRRPSVVPQQALALANSEITLHEARSLVKKLTAQSSESDEAFVRRAFEQVLARHPKPDEVKLCREFLEQRAKGSSDERTRENLVTVLFNHNDFVTVR